MCSLQLNGTPIGMWSAYIWNVRIACAALNLTLLYLGLGQPIVRQMPEERFLSSSQRVLCSTARELADALANPLVNVAVVIEDLKLTESEFVFDQQPGSIVLQRNFTIRGPETDRPTVLDLNFLRAKVLLNGSLTLAFENLMLVNCRRGSATQQPGFDILSVTRDARGRVSIIEMRDCLIVYMWCFPPNLARKAFENLMRPSEIPGYTSYILPYSSPYTCTNSSSTTALQSSVPASPTVNLNGLTWLSSGCFQHVAFYVDVAAYGGDMNDDGTPAYNNVRYPVHALNTMALCVDILPDDCLQRYGPLGCFTFLTKAQSTPPSQNPPSLPPGASVVRGVMTTVVTSVDDASSDSKHQRTTVLLGSIIGGVAFFAATATLVIILGRRRRWWPDGWLADTGATTHSICISALTKSSSKSLGCRHGVPPAELLSPPGPPLTFTGSTPEARPKAPGVKSQRGEQQQRQQQQLGTVNWCLRLMSAVEAPAAAVAMAEDATLQPVTALTPLHPDINLDIQPGGQEGSGDDTANHLYLSGITLGKGAFGRVVAGTYGGVRVAVKIIDQGLLYHSPPDAVRYNSQNGNGGEAAAKSNQDKNHVQGCGTTTTASATAAAGGEVRASPAMDLEKGSLQSINAIGVAPPLPLPPFKICCNRGGDSDSGGVIGRSGDISTGGPGLQADAALPQEAWDSLYAGCFDEPNGAHSYTSEASDATAVSAKDLATGPAATLALSSSPKAADVAVPIPPTAVVAAYGTAAVTVVNCHPLLCSLSCSTMYASLTSKNSIACTACNRPGYNTGGGSEDLTHTQTHRHYRHDAQQLDASRDALALGSPPVAATATATDAHEDEKATSALASPPAFQYELALKQEVEVLARCQHPNIVRLLAASLRPPRFCLVMELMESSLERLLYKSQVRGIRQSKLLPLDTVLHIAIQIAKGLAYLHPTIIHRDLKPGNVLISQSATPDRPIVKLADFGLSRLLNTVLVTEHPEVGTAPYIAPEAFDVSNKRITDRVDVYALGIILWEMLAGQPPWFGINFVVIALSVCMYQQRPPLTAMPHDRCPPKLHVLIETCWDQIPERRPAAAEVVKNLILIQQQVNRSNTCATGADSTSSTACVNQPR